MKDLKKDYFASALTINLVFQIMTISNFMNHRLDWGISLLTVNIILLLGLVVE
jgi:hypothetical protein